MRLLPFLNAVVCLTLVSAAFVQAADMEKIDHPLVKEPAYQSKAPKYALTVFGPEARMCIWLVLDETTLYVDRNGNGDLTEAGEKLSGTKGKQAILEEDVSTFVVGELRDGDRRHGNVSLIATGLSSASQTKTAASGGPPSLSFRVRMEAEIPGFEGVTKDGRVLQVAGLNTASLQFADWPGSTDLALRRPVDAGRVRSAGVPGQPRDGTVPRPGYGGPGTGEHSSIPLTRAWSRPPSIRGPKSPSRAKARRAARKSDLRVKGSVLNIQLTRPSSVPANVGTGATLVKVSFDNWDKGQVRSSELEVRTVSPRSGPSPLPVSPLADQEADSSRPRRNALPCLVQPRRTIHPRHHGVTSHRLQIWNANTGEQIRTLQLPKRSINNRTYIYGGSGTLAPDGRTLDPCPSARNSFRRSARTTMKVRLLPSAGVT